MDTNKGNFVTGSLLFIFSLIGSIGFATPEDEDNHSTKNYLLNQSTNRVSNDESIDSLIRLAAEHRNRGEPDFAIKVLNQALSLSEKENDIARLALIYGGFSDAFLLTRRMDIALSSAEKSVEFARRTTNSLILATALNHYGNVLVAMQRYEDAFVSYQEGVTFSKQHVDSKMTVKLHINMIHAHLAEDSLNKAVQVLKQTSREMKTLPDSHEKTYLLVALGHLAQRLHFENTNYSGLLSIAYTTFTDALNISTTINDIRGQSYALGHLGELYTAEQRYADAEQLFHKAIFFANQTDAPELTARWLWQLGRLFKTLNQIAKAEAAYKKSLAHLSTIQPALVYGYRGNPQSFRETVGVIYLELLDILLHKASKINDENSQRNILKDVRNIMEKYKTVELKNYFQDDCVTELQARNSGGTIDDLLSTGTATLYPIIFSDRITLLLSFADGSMKQMSVPISAEELAKAVTTFRRELNPSGNLRRLRSSGWILYNWLIKPLEAELTNQKIKTLVIVPDGILGTIPFAALYDGEDFLVKRYAFVTTPGLSLTLSGEQSQVAKNQQALLNGLSRNVQHLEQLPNVVKEIEKVADQFKNSTQLLNEDFKKHSVENYLQSNPYTTVLFASHAELKANPKQSYILTYDDKISLNELDRYLRIGKYRENPVNLLVLSACNTARGDERAAFGLAGVAVKAGVSSVLASLWGVSDESTSELIPLFFENLKKPEFTKALALQQAQKKLIKSGEYKHPYYWASFVLFGNWI